MIARLGGDEFVLVQNVPDRQRENAIMLANRLLEAIAAPYEIDGHQIVIGTSIGIALAPNDGDTADELLKNADLALYRVKSEGRNGYRFFEQEMDDEAQSRHMLQADLRTALARGEFELHFQTVFDAKTRIACGAEALVRWRHPTRGMIPPGQFIQLAEEIGVIVPARRMDSGGSLHGRRRPGRRTSRSQSTCRPHNSAVPIWSTWWRRCWRQRAFRPTGLSLRSPNQFCCKKTPTTSLRSIS